MAIAPTMTVTSLPIDEIRPYWRNPRTQSPDAIDKIAALIIDYGYRQPIVVDGKHVVITGHTRLAALRQLGWTDIPVIVADDLPETKVREYRVLDNRAHELTGWDDDALLLELREFTDPTLLDVYFPDIDLTTEFAADYEPVTAEDTEAAAQRMGTPGDAPGRSTVTFTCPNCLTEIEVEPPT